MMPDFQVGLNLLYLQGVQFHAKIIILNLKE